MTNPFALPALGLSLLAATAVGIQLGESAIASINPIYLKGPPLHPRDRGAAIDERDVQLARAPAPAPLYGWEQGYAARASACEDCGGPAGDGEVYSAVVPYFGDSPAARKPAEHREAAAVRVHRGSAERAEKLGSGTELIELYAETPLDYEEAVFLTPAVDALPAEGEDSFHY